VKRRTQTLKNEKHRERARAQASIWQYRERESEKNCTQTYIERLDAQNKRATIEREEKKEKNKYV